MIHRHDRTLRLIACCLAIVLGACSHHPHGGTHPVAVQAAERPESASGAVEGEIVIAQVARLEYKAHEEWLEDGTVWVTNVVALDVVAPRPLDALLFVHVAGHPRIDGRPLLLGDRVTFVLPENWRGGDLALADLPGLKFVE
jgi:hypothetical protein